MRSLKRLLPYLWDYKSKLCLGFVFMFIMNYAYTKVPTFMRKLLDEIQGENRSEVIFTNCANVIGYAFVTASCMYMMRQLIIGSSRHIEYRLRKALYEKLLSLDFKFFSKNNTGDLISRCTNDLDHVRVLLGPGIMYLPNSISRLLLFAPILLELNQKLAFALFSLIFVLVALIVIIMPRMKPLHKKLQEHVGSVNDRVWQTLSGMQTIKLYGREKVETDRFSTLNKEYIARNMKIEAYQSFLWPFFLTMFGVTELILLGVGGQEVIAGKLTLGELLQFEVMVAVLTFPVLSLGWVMSVMQQGISAMERIELIFNAQSKADVDYDDVEIEIDDKNDPIVCENLTYIYPNHTKPILKNINLTLKRGQVIGITGPVGSGKSTLLNLISGTLEANAGQLFINGKDVVKLNPEIQYALMSYVPQDTFLFSTSLENNIALSQLSNSWDLTDAQKSKVVEVSKLASLHKDILSFAKGYQEVVGEKGMTLSGGQRQRVSIARALFKDVDLLLLDDALSSIDANTEKEILEHIQSLGKNRSMIIVSHRVSSIRFSDCIYYLDKGEITEQGTHNELVEKEGAYAKIAKLQKMKEEAQL